ncbi:hypothetical protein SAMN04515674_11037 [Pseudarcicella hirudinis]|uniref:Uncharacterized protein n=1 Tax=Pseudarcicella hirudinis TaxID=1079859 RepID=A0A1I5VT53_9BACT|nr:hypothetical protein SAMN04515674_11037 [Pseudarcicella hirudinis]
MLITFVKGYYCSNDLSSNREVSLIVYNVHKD